MELFHRWECYMRKHTLAERILCIITYLQESTLKTITETKLKELLGNPPRSTYYRILKMLLNGGADYRPLIKRIESSGEVVQFKSYFS
jgi:hypothetical protein